MHTYPSLPAPAALSVRRPVANAGPGRLRRAIAGSVGMVALAGGLAACHVPQGESDDQVVVDFVTATPGAARTTVENTCGHFAATPVLPSQATDPSVHFDIKHADNAEVITLTNCLGTLINNKALQIRGVRIEDGSDT